MKGWSVLIAFAVAWLVAQISKVIIRALRHEEPKGKLSFDQMVAYFMQSGGMPSGHTASLTAATVCLGFLEGFGSGVFALAVCVWFLIVYDATHVRYAVGIQGEALNKLLKRAGEPELVVEHGHTLPQVCVGALIGIVVGVIFGILVI